MPPIIICDSVAIIIKSIERMRVYILYSYEIFCIIFMCFSFLNAEDTGFTDSHFLGYCCISKDCILKYTFFAALILRDVVCSMAQKRIIKTVVRLKEEPKREPKIEIKKVWY